MQAGGVVDSHNTCLHTDSLAFEDEIVVLTH